MQGFGGGGWKEKPGQLGQASCSSSAENIKQRASGQCRWRHANKEAPPPGSRTCSGRIHERRRPRAGQYTESTTGLHSSLKLQRQAGGGTPGGGWHNQMWAAFRPRCSGRSSKQKPMLLGVPDNESAHSLSVRLLRPRRNFPRLPQARRLRWNIPRLPNWGMFHLYGYPAIEKRPILV
jgi:hypothetical protein